MNYKKMISVGVAVGLLGVMTQIIFAQMTTTDTTAPVISNLHTENIIGSGAQVKWDTNQLSDSGGTYYSTATAGVASYPASRCDDIGLVLHHCLSLINLYPGSTYNYRVESHNASGILAYMYGTFLMPALSSTNTSTTSTTTTTPTSTTDTTAPVISNAHAENITSSTAQIMWITDEPSDSRVSYIPSSAPTFIVGARCDALGNVLLHCVNITGLLPGYDYYFKVGSINIVGLLAEDSGYFVMPMSSGISTSSTTTQTNTTAIMSTSTTTVVAVAPVISNLHTDNIIDHGAQVKWNTDQLSDSGVYYSMTTGGAVLYSNNRCDGGVPVLQHCVNLTDLYQGSTFNYKVESHSIAGLLAYAYGNFLIPLQSETFASTTIAPVNMFIINPTVESTTSAPAPATLVAHPLVATSPSYPAALPPKPASVQIAPAPPISETTRIPVPMVGPLKSEVTLKNAGNVFDGEEVHVKVNQSVSAVEMRLSRKESNESLYLGQAQYDPAKTEWVFHWDSTQTPDGSYTLSPMIKTVDETVVRGEEKKVIVRNEKMTEATRLPAGGPIPGITVKPVTLATGTTAVSGAGASGVAPVPVIDPEKFIEQIKKEKQQEEEQIKKDIANTLIAHLETATNAVVALAVHEETIKKIEALKVAINEGNIERKKAIIADIVDTAAIMPGGVAHDILVKKVEAGVAKLEQVTIEQKTGVVDVKNFSVDALRVAEVTTKPDGTQVASKVEFKGKAIPNSFATIYIFSIPIVVTVKTDKDGYWNYTLDKELENGKHQVFVAITDVKGAVVAKSNALPFIKEASAITLDQVNRAPVQQESPSFVGDNYFYGSIIATILIIVAIFFLLGWKTRETPKP